MRILIAGGSGFIGQALIKYLQTHHYDIIVIGRNKNKLQQIFGGQVSSFTWEMLNQPELLTDIDVVINLAGENIGAGIWSQERKQRIIESRINTTEKLVHAFKNFAPKPTCFICASGVGIYPPADVIYDESWEVKENELNSFLGKLAYDWEKAARGAESLGIRVVNTRQGAVLGTSGGMLKSILLPYKLGFGGRLGSGQQPLPWVALPDVVRAIDFIIQQTTLSGPVNLVAPEIVNQATFAKTLAAILHRPAWLATPAKLLKILLGEMAEELLLTGVKVKPEKLLAAGFTFEYPQLKQALTALLTHSF